MKLKNITPKSMRCVGLACPTIFERGNDSYVIIGKALQPGKMEHKLSRKVGPGEMAVEIPKQLLSELK